MQILQSSLAVTKHERKKVRFTRSQFRGRWEEGETAMAREAVFECFSTSFPRTRAIIGQNQTLAAGRYALIPRLKAWRNKP